MTGNGSKPEVSVVIPTAGREARLAFALEALAEQTLDRDRYEVIVVRAPERGRREALASAPDDLRARFIAAPAMSRPGQRNVGWRAATGELVAFTDDDCRPEPGWLEALVSANAGERTFLQGPTEPDPDERHLLFGLARSVSVPGPSAFYETCNIAYPRAMLERLGGFDERFEASGEDTDLGLRALESGAEALFVPGARVDHGVIAQPLHRALEAGWGRWHSTALVYKCHPAHRRHLFGGVFFNRTHAAVVSLVPGVLVWRRRPLVGMVLATPFLVDALDSANLGPRGLARQLIHLPARLLRETAVVAGILRGALRHRTPIV